MIAFYILLIIIAFLLAGILIALCLIVGGVSDRNARGERLERRVEAAESRAAPVPWAPEWKRRN